MRYCFESTPLMAVGLVCLSRIINYLFSLCDTSSPHTGIPESMSGRKIGHRLSLAKGKDKRQNECKGKFVFSIMI